MKRGIITEAHVVIYCDVCGDRFNGEYDDTPCPRTTGEAIAQLRGTTWFYDGDRVFCGTCLTLAECAVEGGHAFTDRRLAWLLPRPKDGARHCRRCGISETEAGGSIVDPPVGVPAPDLSTLLFCCGRRMVFAGFRYGDEHHIPMLQCAECGHYEPDESRMTNPDKEN